MEKIPNRGLTQIDTDIVLTAEDAENAEVFRHRIYAD